jgi:hypothetical protein
MPAIPAPALTGTALALLAATALPALAANCADRPVSARGEPSRLETLAKASARGNWRAKVRAVPTLGAAYANFNKALAADYSCSTKEGQHTCVATGHPCRD